MAVLLLATHHQLASAASFEGVVIRVSDGDTLRVRPDAGGAPVKVRLNGIDAPEICQAHGMQSREALAARVLHRRVKVAVEARDDYERAIGRVSLGGGDLGAWMVEHGHAWSYRFRNHRGPYANQEIKAMNAGRGLWSSQSPIQPRDFRQRHGSCPQHATK